MKNLMIVESPVKIPTIKKYLDDISKNNPKFKGVLWDVKATVGHFNKLSDVGVYKCGYDPVKKDISFSVDKKNIFAQLKNLPKYDTIYIATDLDNEGEGIGFQVKQVVPKKSYSKMIRIGFDEITKSAIEKALENPIGFSENNYNAYKYRAIGDKLIGYYGSARLRQELGYSYSTGRIQADVVLIAGNWETEIKNYKPDYRDRIKVNALGSSAYLYTPEGKIFETKEPYSGTFKVASVDISNEIFSSKEDVRPFVLTDIVNKFASKMSSNLIASNLQTIKDKGYITYHRTDNPKMDDEFYNNNKQSAKKFLEDLNLKPASSKYKTGSDDEKWVLEQKKKGKELHLAHSGIRTTNLLKPANSLDLNKQQQEIYNYIREQTISFFSAPNKWENVEVKLVDEKGYYVKLPFKNFLEINVYKDRDKKSEIGKWNKLKDLKPKDRISYFLENVVVDVNIKPPKMNDTNMIKKLEDLGVGTPATIHSFIPITRDKQVINKGDVKLTDKGWKLYKIFNDKPKEYFFADTGFTKNEFEKTIHKLEKGEVDFNREIEKLIGLVDTNFQKSIQKDFSVFKKVEKKCSNCTQNKFIKESSKKNGYVLFCEKSKINPKKNECGYEFISTSNWEKQPLKVIGNTVIDVKQIEENNLEREE